MHAMALCDPYVGGNVYRGVKADLRAQYANDREVTWFQFSSCTCDIEVEQSEQFLGSSGTRTLFSIELTTGRARVITKFSLVPSEAEVLLPPNSRFKVLGQLDAGNGLVIIQLKELPSRDPILDFDMPVVATAAAAEANTSFQPFKSYPAIPFISSSSELSAFVTGTWSAHVSTFNGSTWPCSVQFTTSSLSSAISVTPADTSLPTFCGEFTCWAQCNPQWLQTVVPFFPAKWMLQAPDVYIWL